MKRSFTAFMASLRLSIFCMKKFVVSLFFGFTVSMDANKTVSYVVDLKKAPGAVFVNDGKTPTECDIAISDEHLSQVLAYIF